MSDENAFTNVPSGLMIKVQVAHEEEKVMQKTCPLEYSYIYSILLRSGLYPA